MLRIMQPLLTMRGHIDTPGKRKKIHNVDKSYSFLLRESLFQSKEFLSSHRKVSDAIKSTRHILQDGSTTEYRERERDPWLEGMESQILNENQAKTNEFFLPLLFPPRKSLLSAGRKTILGLLLSLPYFLFLFFGEIYCRNSWVGRLSIDT